MINAEQSKQPSHDKCMRVKYEGNKNQHRLYAGLLLPPSMPLFTHIAHCAFIAVLRARTDPHSFASALQNEQQMKDNAYLQSLQHTGKSTDRLTCLPSCPIECAPTIEHLPTLIGHSTRLLF
ncbi:hypothetical protein Tcan_14506 [Toxocara canis]|uniref:Uncharacterized protein n=1 Tax=Toxocara canis TaxID=6265 RepID=A0A0B2V9U4_TOXCA|nr:hypothetical protein Tcan_14506 [Toxocara canis]